MPVSSITFSTSFDDALADATFGSQAPTELVQQARRKLEELNRALAIFRNAVPGVAGVVLATDAGTPLAYDLPVEVEAEDAAAAALAERTLALEHVKKHGGEAPASAFHKLDDGDRVLVVFLPNGFLLGSGPDMDADQGFAEGGDMDLGDSIVNMLRN